MKKSYGNGRHTIFTEGQGIRETEPIPPNKANYAGDEIATIKHCECPAALSALVLVQDVALFTAPCRRRWTARCAVAWRSHPFGQKLLPGSAPYRTIRGQDNA